MHPREDQEEEEQQMAGASGGPAPGGSAAHAERQLVEVDGTAEETRLMLAHLSALRRRQQRGELSCIAPRDLQWLRHVIESGLKAPEVAKVLRDEHMVRAAAHFLARATRVATCATPAFLRAHACLRALGPLLVCALLFTRASPPCGLRRGQLQPSSPSSQLSLRSMADVDRFCFALLDARGIRLSPHRICTASKREQVALMTDMGALTKLFCEDPGLAAALDFGARIAPPGAEQTSLWREYSSMQTSDWYRDAVGKAARLAPLAKINAWAIFSDGTVHSSSGAKYHPLMAFNMNLPLDMRYLSQNIVIVGFAPLVQPPISEEWFAALAESRKKKWMRAERLSVSRGVVTMILASCERHATGIVVHSPLTDAPELVVPIVGGWMLDHPQAMEYTAVTQCPFCDVGRQGKTGLADFDLAVTLRTSSAMGNLVRACLANTAGAARSLKDSGAHAVVLPQWSEPYTDAYSNLSLSPLHLLKGNYKDLVQWVLLAVYHALGASDTEWKRWLARIDRCVVRELAAFPAVRGRRARMHAPASYLP